MWIKNVRVINHDKIIQNADVEIQNGVFVQVKPKPGFADKIMVPGFIDTHIHGLCGNDAMDSVGAIEAISKDLTRFGTTSYLSTIMTAPMHVLVASLENHNIAKPQGARLMGIHMEGPWISHLKRGAQNPGYIREFKNCDFEVLLQKSKGLLKKISYAPEVVPPGFTKRLLVANIVPVIGHSNATFSQATTAFKNGAMACTHLWNGMSGVANRAPGLAQAVLYNDKCFPELITDLVHIDRETIRFSVKIIGADRVTVVTDAIRPAGLPDGEYTSGGLQVTKKQSWITLRGTDKIAGSASTMHQSFLNLIALKYKPTDVVKMTSYNSACCMGWNKKMGVVKPGFLADFVLMNENWDINTVYVNGVLKYQA